MKTDKVISSIEIIKAHSKCISIECDKLLLELNKKPKSGQSHGEYDIQLKADVIKNLIKTLPGIESFIDKDI